MAISTQGAIVGTISGKLGGSVFIATKRGSIIRNRARTPSVRSERQTSQLSKMQTARLRWQSITQPQRDQWNSAAANVVTRDRLGRRHRLSGFQLYCKVNGISKLFDATFHDTPPATFERYAGTILTIAFSASGTYFLQTSPITIIGVLAGNVWCARPHSNKARKFFRRWVACGVPIAAPPFFPINNIIVPAVGELREGEYVGIRFALRTFGGLVGQFVEVHTVVTA